MTALTHAKGANTLAAYSWTYDAADRVTQFTSTDGTTDYSYDTTDQLTAAAHTYQTNEAWTYDPNGNRTNTGYSTGTNNRLLSDGTYNYEYDAEGNQTKKTTIATGAYEEYTWDHRNRLTAVTFRNSLDAKTKQVLYTYDVHDRLIRKQVDADGNGTVDRAEGFVYDGNNVVLVFDITSAWQNRYLHGDAVDQVFMQEDVGEILWGLADNQGTIRDVANYDPLTDTSAVLNHRKFNAFGGITAETNSSINYRYAYTGRYFDEDTGIQYNRGRWYDAETARFLSIDPSGLGPDSNAYRYVENSPANYTDPDGLEKKKQGWFSRVWRKVTDTVGGTALDRSNRFIASGNRHLDRKIVKPVEATAKSASTTWKATEGERWYKRATITTLVTFDDTVRLAEKAGTYKKVWKDTEHMNPIERAAVTGFGGTGQIIGIDKQADRTGIAYRNARDSGSSKVGAGWQATATTLFDITSVGKAEIYLSGKDGSYSDYVTGQRKSEDEAVGGFLDSLTEAPAKTLGAAYLLQPRKNVTKLGMSDGRPSFGPNSLGAAQASRKIPGYGWTDNAWWRTVKDLQAGKSVQVKSLRIAAELRKDAFGSFSRSRYRGKLSDMPDLRGTYDWHNPAKMIHPGSHQIPHIQIKTIDGKWSRIEVLKKAGRR